MSTRGFAGPVRSPCRIDRLPPGQSLTSKFPVLSVGSTPLVALEDWTFSLKVGERVVVEWNWKEFSALPTAVQKHDVHCFTHWSKLDTVWRGVLIDDIFAAAKFAPPTKFVLAHCFDGYSTNLPIADLVDAKAMVALFYDGSPLTFEHGGPARLLVPHLYFWKSAKWVKALQFTEQAERGFWELRGAHMYGDPWLEQRSADD